MASCGSITKHVQQKGSYLLGGSMQEYMCEYWNCADLGEIETCWNKWEQTFGVLEQMDGTILIMMGYSMG